MKYYDNKCKGNLWARLSNFSPIWTDKNNRASSGLWIRCSTAKTSSLLARCLSEQSFPKHKSVNNALHLLVSTWQLTPVHAPPQKKNEKENHPLCVVHYLAGRRLCWAAEIPPASENWSKQDISVHPQSLYTTHYQSWQQYATVRIANSQCHIIKLATIGPWLPCCIIRLGKLQTTFTNDINTTSQYNCNGCGKYNYWPKTGLGW